MLLWSFMCLFVLCEGIFVESVSWSGSQSLRVLCVSLTWVDNAKLVMQNDTPHQRMEVTLLHVSANTFVLIVPFILALVVCLYWWPFVVLFCNILAISEIEHLLIYLVDAQVTSLGKHLLKTLVHFLLVVLSLLICSKFFMSSGYKPFSHFGLHCDSLSDVFKILILFLFRIYFLT